MKKLILLLIIVLLFSSSKSIYYEYSNNGKYATLEIKDELLTIYRSNNFKYIYTKNATIYPKTDTTSYIVFSMPLSLYYIEENQTKFNLCGFVYKTGEEIFTSDLTYLKINEDSIISISKLDSV